jgi:hypothetical protein
MTERIVRGAAWAVGVTLLLGSDLAAADGPAIASCTSPTGLLLRRTGENKPWEAVPHQGPLGPGQLLVGMPGAGILSKGGAVRLVLLSDIARQSPFPVVEAAVVLHEPKQADLDFTLDRGRVDVVNTKDQGEATVRVRFRKEAWELALDGPGARVALALNNRWPGGSPFLARPQQAKPELDTQLVVLVLKGSARLTAGRSVFALHAPPGPASFLWDNVAGNDAGPTRLEQLPAWVKPEGGDATPAVQAVVAAVERLRKKLESQPVELALAAALASDDPADRRVAAYGLGAVDALDALSDALIEEKRADVRESAVLALRHFVARGPAQDLKVYEVLVKRQGLTAKQGEAALQLLSNFDQRERAMPELYETLIAYLQHPKLVIRELARWHLYDLAPAGKDIAYDAASSDEQRKEAVVAWRKLIPEGKLPPR